MAMIQCPECGQEISDAASTCPHCGFPVNGTETAATRKSKKGIIAAVIVAVAVIAAVTGIVAGVNASSGKKYVENIKAIQRDMLEVGAEAESACGLIHDVWYDTIHEELNEATMKYTIRAEVWADIENDSENRGFAYWYGRHSSRGDLYNEDFNTSLRALFDDPDFTQTIETIKTNRDDITKLYGAMQNVPSKLEHCRSTLDDLYNVFIDLCNCATNPTGSLTSYTASYNDADREFMNCYRKLDALIPSE